MTRFYPHEIGCQADVFTAIFRPALLGSERATECANTQVALTENRLAVGGDCMARLAIKPDEKDSQEFLPLGATIIATTAELFGVTRHQITGASSAAEHCEARFAIMLALRRLGWSFARISHLLGRRDHTTAVHGVRRGEAIEQADPGFRNAVAMLVGLGE